ncbi:MAG: hypothetical protein Q7S83_04100 [bacterium]|nr:hypothetical protein [bacterium]
MEDQLIKILKSLKSITPDEGFISRSKNLVTAASQHSAGWFIFRGSVLQSIKMGAALTLASGLLFIVLGGISFFNIRNLSPVMLSSVNKENIEAEAENLDFQIQLGQVKYDVDSEKAIGAQIDAVLKNLSL